MSCISSFRERASRLDSMDPLTGFKEAFIESLSEVLYLDGNSLGPSPRNTAERIETVIKDEWGRGLVRSWNAAGWFDLPKRLGDRLAPLIGATPGAVCFGDSVTVNFIKFVAATLELQKGRLKIVTDELNFPSNFYALEGLLNFAGETAWRVERVASPDGITVPTETYLAAIDEETALVTLSHVVFKSGFLQDIATICRRAHEVGALVLVDLSHSIGSVPIELDRWGVDMAVGCSYKFLNGGPGAPAFYFVREGLIDKLPSVLSGWFGAKNPFFFAPHFEPAAGIQRFLVGTPPVLSLQAVEPGIELLLKAGIGRIREKSRSQGQFLLELWEALLQPLGLELGSPRDPDQRGSHVSFRHAEAYRINRAMIEPRIKVRPVIPDFRHPDNLRIGISPLYLSFYDLVEAAERISAIIQTREYEAFDHETATVT